MSELVSAQSPRSSVITGIRRAEAMANAALAVAIVISLGAVGAPFSFLLLGTAVVLLPRRKEADATSRDELRLQLTRQLLSEGRSIRARYDLDSAGTQFELEEWIVASRARMARFPEFAAIYDAHYGNNLVEEMNGRLKRLSEINRLAQASNRSNLPI